MNKDVQNVCQLCLHYNCHLCDRSLLAVVKAQRVSIINTTSVDVVQNNSEMPTDNAVTGIFIRGIALHFPSFISSLRRKAAPLIQLAGLRSAVSPAHKRFLVNLEHKILHLTTT